MSKKKFDVDRFMDELMLEEEIAGYNSLEETDIPYRVCPNCGSEDYQFIYTDKRGRAKNCTECKGEPEN